MTEKLVKEFRELYETKYKDDDKFIYLFTVICDGIDNEQISFKEGRDIVVEYNKKGKLSKSNNNKLHIIEEGGRVGKSKKSYKEGNIMKARSDLKKKGSKYEVETEMNIKEGLEPKVKRALKKSIIEETNKKIKKFKKPVGFGFKGGSINLDYSSSDDSSSSDEEEPKKKVDVNELKNYAKMLSHLLEHIEDPKEKPVKKGRGRPRKYYI